MNHKIKETKSKEREMQKAKTFDNVKLIWIIGAILFNVSAAPKNVSSEKITNDIIDSHENKSPIVQYEILQVHELLSSSSSSQSKENKLDEKNSVITYQQEQQKSYNHENADNDFRLLEVVSKGFDDDNTSSTVKYLIVNRFKDLCEKNASLPSWKIDKGTSNGVFRLKINYYINELIEKDMYLCVFDDEQDAKHINHLGESSLFRLTRTSNAHEIAKRNINNHHESKSLKIIGYRIVESSKEPETDDGIPILRAGSNVKLQLFGYGFSNVTAIGFTAESLEYGVEALHTLTVYFSDNFKHSYL